MKTTNSKLMAILLLFALSTIHSFSQTINLDEISGCLVSDVSGKVTFTERGNPTPKVVTAGMVLADDATLSIGKKSSLTLVNEDHSLVVNKKGSHQMANLAAEVKAKGEVSRFAKMAFAAKGYVAPDTTKKIKGWGDKDSILFKLPTKGKIPLNPVRFNWTSVKPGSIYKLVIFQNDKANPVLQAVTSAASFDFNPAQLSVQLGQTCNAQVVLVNDPSVASKVVQFTFVKGNEAEDLLASLKKEKAYINGTPMQRSLMEATEFENNQYFSMAIEKYQNAIKTGGGSSLAQQMYAAFLERTNK